MSALDLTRLNTTIRRCAATLLDASYTDGIPTETTDVWRTIAADAARDLTDMIRRLRAAEARTAWQPIETAPRGADLRTLAQAVVDAGPTECIWPVNAPTSALLKALMPEVGDKASPLYDTARTILAALNAERAQGYARAMGDVVEHASQQSDECHETRWDPCVMGRQDAWDDCYEWARERLPAAAERD